MTVLFLTNVWIVAIPAQGQDDPDDPFAFGGVQETVAEDSDTLAPSAVDEADVDRSLSEGVRLIILSVRNANPSTPVELARAINSMLNIQQYGEARRYLKQLADLNANDAQIYEMLQRMGPAFFVELRDTRPLLPESREFADRVFEIARQQAYSPDRINELISRLSEDDRFVRSEAFRKLRRLGAPAAAAMLNVCADETRRRELPFVQSALKNMGPAALLPMIGAARADGTIVQAVAVGALTSMPSALAVDPLYRAAISPRVPETVRAIAAEFVAGQGLTDSERIKRRICLRATAYLDGEVNLPSDSSNQTEIWNWNADAQQLLPTRVDTTTAARILAIDLARDVYQLDSDRAEYRQLLLLTVLDASKRLLGPNRFVRVDEVTPFVPDITPAEVDQALGIALEKGRLPAAIAAAEIAGQLGDATLLMTPTGRPSPLIRAILTGQRHLQFAAAKTITQLDPQSPYPGCSYVAQLMTFLANSRATATGLVLHPRPDIAGVLASSVSQSGLLGKTVNTPQQLFDELNTNPDIELVLLTDATSSPRCEEIVQQIRRNWLSRRMPVGLLSRSFDREMQAEEVLSDDPLTWVMPLTSDPGLVFSQIERLRGFAEPWAVSDVQRDQHARLAVAWLAKVMAEPERYRFYDLKSHQKTLLHLIHSSGSESERNRILVELGTPASQQALADLASEEGMPVTQREAYADSFQDSVSRHGILLTSGQIQRQYDRYNAAEYRDRADTSQAILGSILDALESSRDR